MMSNSWLELNIAILDKEAEVLLGYFDEYTLGNHIEKNSVSLYFERRDKSKIESIISNVKKKFEIEKIKWTIINEENWMENWMENFHPVNIDDKVMILPNWDNTNYESMHTIKIYPAMAFGTGHHESTQLIIEHMINCNIGSYSSLLDLGCGSGILSFLSSKMGVPNITSIDVDPICEENFYKNSKLNNIDNIDFSIQDVHEFENYSFDIILANIDKKNIIKILKKYEKYNSKAILIIAGLLHTDENEILNCLKNSYVDSLSRKGEWISMLIKRKDVEK